MKTDSLPSLWERRMAVVERQMFWMILLLGHLLPVWFSRTWKELGLGLVLVTAGALYLHGTRVLRRSRELSVLGGIGPLRAIEFMNRELSRPKESQLAFDERELALRQRAFSISYHVLCGALLLMFGYLVAAKEAGAWVPTNIYTLLWIPLWFALNLPTDVIAWIEPNRPEAEQE